ncbi:MAG: MATE family efflux transporter [Ruminococcaceae bacterium]|nr:MATE family efflux transporter [Oscillospiraceae bacterium]
MAAEVKSKTAGMQLYEVDVGSDEFLREYSTKKSKTKHIPEGVSSRGVYRDIVQIAWPTLIELTLAQLTSMFDMMMVGNLGEAAISSVSLATQPKFILNTIFMSMNVGATALVARCKGARQPERANHFVRQALMLNMLLAAISMVVGLVWLEPLVGLMKPPSAASFQGGMDYLRIQIYGIIPLALTFTITALLRGVGNSKTAMKYNLVANAVNILGNYLLIEGRLGFPALGVVGASLATVIGQCVAFVIAMIVITKPGQYIRLQFTESFKPDFAAYREIAKIGIPAMVENVIMRVAIIIYTRTVTSLGETAYATHNVCMNIQALSFMTGQAFATSATSLMGQSLGRRRPDMGEIYAKYTRRMGLVVSLLLALVFFFFGAPIIRLYTDSAAVVETGKYILMFVAFMQPFQSSQFIIAGGLRGAGDTRSIAIIVTLTTLGVRTGFAVLAVNVFQWGLYGAWAALVADQLLRSLLVLMRFNSGKWKTIKVKI